MGGFSRFERQLALGDELGWPIGGVDAWFRRELEGVFEGLIARLAKVGVVETSVSEGTT